MRAKSGGQYLLEACEHYGLSAEELFGFIDDAEKKAGDMAYKVQMLRELYQGSTTKLLADKYGLTVRKVYSIITDARFRVGGLIYRRRGEKKQSAFQNRVQQSATVSQLASASEVSPHIIKFILEHPELSNMRLEGNADSIELVRQYLNGTSIVNLAEENADTVSAVRTLLQDTMLLIAQEATQITWHCKSWLKEVGGNSPISIAASYGITREQYDAAVEKTFENEWLKDRGKKVYECWAEQRDAVDTAIYCVVGVGELTSRIRLVLRNVTMHIPLLYPQAVATAMEMSSTQAVQRSTQSETTIFS